MYGSWMYRHFVSLKAPPPLLPVLPSLLHFSSPRTYSQPGAVVGRIGRARASHAGDREFRSLVLEHGSRVRDVESLVLGRVQLMTYKIDTCHFLARRSTLIG